MKVCVLLSARSSYNTLEATRGRTGAAWRPDTVVVHSSWSVTANAHTGALSAAVNISRAPDGVAQVQNGGTSVLLERGRCVSCVTRDKNVRKHNRVVVPAPDAINFGDDPEVMVRAAAASVARGLVGVKHQQVGATEGRAASVDSVCQSLEVFKDSILSVLHQTITIGVSFKPFDFVVGALLKVPPVEDVGTLLLDVAPGDALVGTLSYKVWVLEEGGSHHSVPSVDLAAVYGAPDICRRVSSRHLAEVVPL